MCLKDAYIEAYSAEDSEYGFRDRDTGEVLGFTPRQLMESQRRMFARGKSYVAGGGDINSEDVSALRKASDTRLMECREKLGLHPCYDNFSYRSVDYDSSRWVDLSDFVEFLFHTFMAGVKINMPKECKGGA